MTRRPEPVIRPARESDLDGIEAVLAAAFPATYTGVLSDAAIAAWTAAGRARRQVEEDWPDMWVAELDGEIVGFVQVDAARLANIWIAAAAQGMGLGARLLGLAETVIQRTGHRQARLEVFEGNDRAHAFYRSRSWSDVGRDTFDIAGHPVPGIVMVKDLRAD